VSLANTLYDSLSRRVRVMRTCGSHPGLIGYVIWLAIETYVQAPGKERLSAAEADDLYDELEPLFWAPAYQQHRNQQQELDDAVLRLIEKERRREAYAVTGRTFLGRKAVAL
jgi:L-lactate utilization protein LutC